MAAIGITDCGGERFFLVQCVEPLQKMVPSDPPYPRLMLTVAVELCPDARMWVAGYEHIPIPGDLGDEEYYFALAITEENALALLATGFGWLPEASEAAAAFSIPSDRIDDLRREIRSSLDEQRQACMRAFREGTSEDLDNVYNDLFPRSAAPPPKDRREGLKEGIHRLREEIRRRNLIASVDHFVGILDDPEEDDYAKEVVAEHLLEVPDLDPDIALRVRNVLRPWRARSLESSTEWNELPRWKRALYGALLGVVMAAFFVGWATLIDDEGPSLKYFLEGTLYLGTLLAVSFGVIAALIDS